MKQIIISTIFICIICIAAAAQNDEPPCPSLSVEGPSVTVEFGKPIAFEAKLSEGAEKLDIEFLWSVNQGKIVSGQGTKRIEVIEDKATEGATATVELKIQSINGCRPIASESFYRESPPLPRKVDEFESVSHGNVRAHLDNFLAELTNDANSEGLIELELNKNWSYSQKYLFVKLICDHLNFRKFDKSRIKFSIDLSGSYDQEETVLWVISPGAEFPGKDDENLRFVKAEDMDKELPRLFRAKTKK